MISIVFALLFLAFVGYAVIPFSGGLNWTEEFFFVLKGALPLIAIGIALLCFIVGLADIIDRYHAKKEALLQEEFEKKEAAKEVAK